jgi:hypothetical protein
VSFNFNIPAVAMPVPPLCEAAAEFHSATSVHDVPFQDSVLPLYGLLPPVTVPLVLEVPNPARPSSAVERGWYLCDGLQFVLVNLGFVQRLNFFNTQLR